MRPEQIKKKYRRAVLLVHPDKQKDKPPAQALLAERMFEKLKVRCRTFSSLCAAIARSFWPLSVCLIAQAEWAKIEHEVGDTAAPVEQQSSGPVDPSWGVDNSSEVKGD